MKVFEVLAHALADNGVDTLFGLLGDANLFMVDSFVRKGGGKYVAAGNESGAVLMALGYSALSGKVGVVTVTHGPALTNTVTSLIEGVKALTPLVLLCGDTALTDRDNLQNIPQREIIVASGAGFEQLRSPNTVEEDLATAFRRAVAERRPIALNVPTDLLWQEGPHDNTRWITPPQTVLTPAGDALEDAVGIIASSKRPVVLAGRGAIDPASRSALVRLAERIEAPLATTLKARDLFRDCSYNLGIFGTLSTPQTVDAILRSDCVIAFGAGLNSYTTSNDAFLSDKRVVQISSSPTDIGRNHRPTVGLVANPVEAVERLIYWLDQAQVRGSGYRSERLRKHSELAASSSKFSTS